MSHSNRNRAQSKVESALNIAHDHEHDYSALLQKITESFSVHSGALMQVQVPDLYEVYLNLLPAEKQVHTCHACARFIRTYGNLATVNEDGTLRSAVWSASEVPEFYASVFNGLKNLVEKGRITSPFLSKDRIWGTPITGSWSHPALVPDESLVYRERTLTASQAMAAKRENYGAVARALAEFKSDTLDQLLRLFETESIREAERFVGPLKFLRKLQDRPKGRKGENILWAAIATAPEGFCHPRTSVVAPLLQAVADGASFSEIEAKFREMTHGLRYQRPQAAPSAATIAQAERLVEQLGIQRSLERRFALLSEMRGAIWLPSTKEQSEPKTGGVFANVVAKGSQSRSPIGLPVQTLTWAKFKSTILSAATELKVLAPPLANYRAIVTAANDDAPVIMKWLNPFSGYVYNGGATAGTFGLLGGTFVPALGIFDDPSNWDNASPYENARLLIVLKGCHDTRTDQGNALFPETLRNDLHGIRAVIEKYSAKASLTVPEGQLACGLDLAKNSCGYRIKAEIAGAWNEYYIDRWD